MLLTLGRVTQKARSSATYVILTLGLLGAVGTELAAAAGPVGNGYLYSHKDKDASCTPGSIADPITVFLIGSAATTRKAAGYERGGPFQGDVDGDITIHTRKYATAMVRHNTDNTFRQRWNPFDCTQNPGDTDLATAAGYGNHRTHLRMWQEQNPTRSSLGSVVMTPHIEDWYGDKDCDANDVPGFGSHAVERGAVDRGDRYRERRGSGFDRGRRYLALSYKGSRHHKQATDYLGNTRSIKQCDGEWAGSDGNYVRIGIGSRQCQAVKDPLPGCPKN